MFGHIIIRTFENICCHQSQINRLLALCNRNNSFSHLFLFTEPTKTQGPELQVHCGR